MKKIIYTEAILIHQFIRKSIYKIGYIETLKSIKKDIFDCLALEDFTINLKASVINKMLNYIVNEDKENSLVSSCISITILAHILCILSNIKSKIVIGVKIENGKLFSHSWLKVIDSNKKIINYFEDYRNYKVIKEFCLGDL